MRSGHLLALLLVLEGLLTAHAQITVGTSVAAAALGAAALGGVGLLALGAARRGSRRRARRRGRRGRSAEDELDLPSIITMRLAAAQDGSGCGQKLVCLLAASESRTPLESDIVEFVQSRRAALAAGAPAAAAAAVRATVGQRFQAAKQLGETGGDCAATYSGCSRTKEQLTQFAAGRVAAARARLDGAGN